MHAREIATHHGTKPLSPAADALVRTVSCPACGAPVEWLTTSEFRPFCSARCKGMDFGAWASERYRVESNDEPDLLPTADEDH